MVIFNRYNNINNNIMKELNKKQQNLILQVSILIADKFDTDRKDVKNRKKISKIEDEMLRLLTEMSEELLNLTT